MEAVWRVPPGVFALRGSKSGAIDFLSVMHMLEKLTMDDFKTIRFHFVTKMKLLLNERLY